MLSPERSAPTKSQAPVEQEWINRGEVLVFGRDVVIRANERARSVVAIGGDIDVRGRVDDEVVALGGDVEIVGLVGKLVAIGGDVEMNGRVTGEVVAILGDVKLAGPIGKLVAILGDVAFGAKSSVGGEVVAIGGDFRNPNGVTIGGQTVSIGRFFPKLAPMLAWLGDGFSKARLLVPGLVWPWYVFGGFALFYLLLAAVFGRGVNACARTLEESPGTTLATAIVLLPLLPLFVLLLILTGVGVLLLPFLAVAVLFAIAFGKTAVMAFLGRCVLRPFGAVGAVESAWLTALVGVVLLAALYCVPVVGLLVWGLTTWVGFGMVVAAIRENRRKEKARIAALRPAVSPVPDRPAEATGFVASGSAASASPAMAATEAASFTESAAGAPVPPVFPPAPPLPLALDLASLPRADFWLRLGAILIDIVVVWLPGLMSLGLGLVPFPLLFGAYVFGFWLWKGTTIGGIVFNLKVVRLDGRPVDAATALVRMLVAFLSVAALGLGFLWCLWDPEGQTWHDKVAGTNVVRVPKSVSLV